MKTCRDCDAPIEPKDQPKGRCIDCRRTRFNSEKMHPLGLYKGIVKRSKLRRHNTIIDRDEFIRWLIEDTEYRILRLAWQESGYQKNLAPSIDAIDPNIGYTLDNIQLLTWKENNQKGHTIDLDKKPTTRNTTGHTGVHQSKISGKFQAGLTVNGVSYRSKWADTLNEAVILRANLIAKYRS